jgi:hypothetical protein
MLDMYQIKLAALYQPASSLDQFLVVAIESLHRQAAR